MTLEEYLFENKLTVKAFAESIGFYPQYVSSCKNGRRKPSKRLIYMVMKVTKGKVNLL